MIPLTLLAAQKVANLMTEGNALTQQVQAIAAAAGLAVPLITSAQVVLSAAAPDLADMDLQLTYPRVCLYSSGVKNTQVEKFRPFSGTVSVVAEVWASGNLATESDLWIHYYVEAVTSLLRENIGDWGDGVFFSGMYDVQLGVPKAGGSGYVESAKITCTLNASRN